MIPTLENTPPDAVVVVGIDIGFRATGFTFNRLYVEGDEIVDTLIGCSCVFTKPSAKKHHIYTADDDIQCAIHLAHGFMNVVRYNQVKGIFAEAPTGGSQSGRASRLMGMATGVAASVLGTSRAPVAWIPPAASKQHLFSKESVSKSDMMDLMTRKYPHYRWPDKKKIFEHVADAQAAYLTGKETQLWSVLCRFVLSAAKQHPGSLLKENVSNAPKRKRRRIRTG